LDPGITCALAVRFVREGPLRGSGRDRFVQEGPLRGSGRGRFVQTAGV